MEQRLHPDQSGVGHGDLCRYQLRPGPGVALHGGGAGTAPGDHPRAVPAESGARPAGHAVFLLFHPER